MVQVKDFFISNSKFTFSQDFIQKTREIFEPLLCHNKKLSDEECIEIANNVLELELFLQHLEEKNG